MTHALPAPLVEIWRGSFLECVHYGHAVVVHANGDTIAEFGDPDAVILPRSSCKMLQALPLVESGAAKRARLNENHLALACASHQGAQLHVDHVSRWLGDLGYSETDLRCGAQQSSDPELRHQMRANGMAPDQRHNNCSGKHTGFLTLNKDMGGDREYLEIDHPLQHSVKSAFLEMCETGDLGYAIDGCSAPNFATTVRGLARAMAKMADPSNLGTARGDAARDLVGAMAAKPELVAGDTRACTDMMQAMNNGTVVKTGAEGVFAGIIPSKGIGVALKITDGNTRGSEAAMASILIRLGMAKADDPKIAARSHRIIRNWNGLETGAIRPAPEFYQNGQAF